MNQFDKCKSAGPMLLVLALAVPLTDVDTFAGIETKGLRVTQEAAIILTKTEAVRTKRANSIEDITRVEVVTDPGKHDWDKDKEFNGESYYKDSKLKHKKYWTIFFEVCCRVGNHGLVLIDATSGVVLEVHGGQ